MAIHGPLKANGDAPEWRLTVCSAGGLANRLKVLTSGLALAEATGRAFRMLWPLNANCTAPFATLFYYLVKAVGRLRYGRGIPFAKLWMWLIGKRLPRRYQFPGVRP